MFNVDSLVHCVIPFVWHVKIDFIMECARRSIMVRMKCDINFSIVTIPAKMSLLREETQKIKMTLGKIDINPRINHAFIKWLSSSGKLYQPSWLLFLACKLK